MTTGQEAIIEILHLRDAPAELALFVVAAISATLYFVPTIVAKRRKQPQLAAIFVVNLCFGWTGLGWIAALVWALIRQTPPAPPAAPGYRMPPLSDRT